MGQVCTAKAAGLCPVGLAYIAKRGITEATLASLAQIVQFNSYTAYGKTHLECHIPGYIRYQRRIIAPEVDRTSFAWDGKGKGTGAELPILGLKEALESNEETLYIVNGPFGYLSFYQITGQFNGFGLIGGEGNNHKEVIKSLADANFHGTLVWLCDYDEKLDKKGEPVWASHTYAAKFRDALIESGFVGSFFALDYPNPTVKGYDLNDALIANLNLTLSDLQSFPLADLPIEEKHRAHKPTLSIDISGSDTAAKIISGFPIDAYIERDTGQYAKNGGNIFCPFCEDGGTSKSPSFHIYPNTNSFHCFACLASGNVIGYVAKKNGISNKEAFERLARELGVWVERAEYAKLKGRDVRKAKASDQNDSGPQVAPASSLIAYHEATQRFLCPITECSDTYVTFERIDSLGKFVCVQKQTGGGKTTWPIKAAGDGKRVLIVAHLIRILDSVVSAAGQEGVSFTHYYGAPKDELLNTERLAITVNSLSKLTSRKVGFNIIVFDEINNIIDILTNPTSHIKDKQSVIDAIKDQIESADKVVFQSAHIDARHIDVLQRMFDIPIEMLRYSVKQKGRRISVYDLNRATPYNRDHALSQLVSNAKAKGVPNLIICTTPADCVIVSKALKALGMKCALPIIGKPKGPKTEENVAEDNQMIEQIYIPNEDALDLASLTDGDHNKVSIVDYITNNLNDGTSVVISPVGAIGLSLDRITTECAVSILAVLDNKSSVNKRSQMPSDLRFVIQAAARIRKECPVYLFGLPYDRPFAATDLTQVMSSMQNSAKFLMRSTDTEQGSEESEYDLSMAHDAWAMNNQRIDVTAALRQMFKSDGYENVVLESEDSGLAIGIDVYVIKAIKELRKEIRERKRNYGKEAYCARSLDELAAILNDRLIGTAELLKELECLWKGQRDTFFSEDSIVAKKQIESYRHILAISFLSNMACEAYTREALSVTNGYTISLALRNIFLPIVARVLGLGNLVNPNGTYDLLNLEMLPKPMSYFAQFDREVHDALIDQHDGCGSENYLKLLDTLCGIDLRKSTLSFGKGQLAPGHLTVIFVRQLLALFCIELDSKRVKANGNRESFLSIRLDNMLTILSLAKEKYAELWAPLIKEMESEEEEAIPF
jgi:hypothetical protein